ncbi:hypothetical protein GF360_00235 [candidate division WWE3 bacterium]|nr:hypothetical protein [candidate division WWE3 bacterium]
MNKIKTTVKIDADLKKELERLALERDSTLQDMFNKVLYEGLLGVPLKELRQPLKPVDLDPAMDNFDRAELYD